MENMAASIETKRKLRAIRRLSSPVPDRTAEERLGQIGDVLSGKIDSAKFTNVTSPTLLKRLKEGQASRSPRNAFDKRPPKKPEPEVEEKKRKFGGGRNRMETGGMNRSEDVNR
jgi:hypothetical protein